MSERRYSMYPSLLNGYVQFLNREMMGQKILTTEEDLLRSLNRVKTPSSPAALKGISLEHCVRTKTYTHEGFVFSREVIDDMHQRTAGGFWSKYFESTETIMHNSQPVTVKLYGIVDVVRRNEIIDVKGTGMYNDIRFNKKLQHTVYCHTARASNVLVDGATYLITDYSSVYEEYYSYDKESVEYMWSVVRGLIDFAEQNRELIVNDKFFM